jgi:hypothetical protein
MEKLKFKQGDWCFCDFKLQQVKETEDNRIVSVFDGTFIHSGYDLSDNCYPLEMKVKQISDIVYIQMERFQALKNNALNYPDLNRKLIEVWIELCDNRENKDKLKELYNNLFTFCDYVINKSKNLNNEKIEGVNLFRK